MVNTPKTLSYGPDPESAKRKKEDLTQLAVREGVRGTRSKLESDKINEDFIKSVTSRLLGSAMLLHSKERDPREKAESLERETDIIKGFEEALKTEDRIGLGLLEHRQKNVIPTSPEERNFETGYALGAVLKALSEDGLDEFSMHMLCSALSEKTTREVLLGLDDESKQNLVVSLNHVLRSIMGFYNKVRNEGLDGSNRGIVIPENSSFRSCISGVEHFCARLGLDFDSYNGRVSVLGEGPPEDEVLDTSRNVREDIDRTFTGGQK